jgi:hypothetical protein
MISLQFFHDFPLSFGSDLFFSLYEEVSLSSHFGCTFSSHVNLNHFAYLVIRDIGRCLTSVVVFILRTFVFIQPRLNNFTTVFFLT